jgi:DegV family protein with EDD domain
MRIKITTESTSDLTPELLARYDISTVPLIVVLGDKEFEDGVSITPDEIYAFVEASGVLPKTAAQSADRYTEFFSTYLQGGYDAVVHISLSSGISASHSCAAEAALGLKNVYVFDSLSLSTGTGMQVIYARELADAGFTPPQIIDKLIERRPKGHCSFICDNLKYLHKGGRCSSTEKFLATLLAIKPTIVMGQDGKLVAGQKYMGNLSKVIASYVKTQVGLSPDFGRIFITHTTIDAEIVAKVHALLVEAGFEQIEETTAGATISSHCGKGTLGVLFYGK